MADGVRSRLVTITFEEAIDMIVKAIVDNQRLRIVYNQTERVVDPYVFGYSSEDNPLFKAFQVEGESLSGKGAGWRVFQVYKLEEITPEIDSLRRPVYFEPLYGDPALTYPWIYEVVMEL